MVDSLTIHDTDVINILFIRGKSENKNRLNVKNWPTTSAPVFSSSQEAVLQIVALLFVSLMESDVIND